MGFINSRRGLAGLILGLVLGLCGWARAQEHAQAPVNVILWFDTEDYISPADDDADKRLAEMLTARHIRATFKVVGEKARVLEKHGRTDVIEALKQHDIGFHSNFHSVHPTVSEYEAQCGLLDGIDEFVRREGPGAADVRRVFGRKSLVCYGQPGSSWAAQAIAALAKCGVENDGIPCYVDSGDHVGFGGIPFWFEGALVVYKMQANETRMDLFAAGGLERGEKAVGEIAQRLEKEGGGLISIYYHPCEWVTSQFWDGANFRRGANPPREDWKLPTQRTAEEAEQAFTRFGAYVDFIHGLPGVKFATASELPKIYPDRVRGEKVSQKELEEIATAIAKADSPGIDDLEIGGKVFSPADQFDLITQALAGRIEKHGEDAVVTPMMLGPDEDPPAAGAAHEPVTWAAFTAAVLDARDFVRVNRRIPSRVFIGAQPVSPADFLVGAGRAYLDTAQDGKFPETVTLGNNVEVLTARRIAKDTPGLFGGWIIHAANFRAPHILEIARLQAWTLKPAVPVWKQSSGPKN
jgi:hypothetical protein